MSNLETNMSDDGAENMHMKPSYAQLSPGSNILTSCTPERANYKELIRTITDLQSNLQSSTSFTNHLQQEHERGLHD